MKKRKKDMARKVNLIGHGEFVQAMMRRCYYMCNPQGEDGILNCVPCWSNNVKCRGDALKRVLDRYPDYKANIIASNYGVADRPESTTAVEYFIEEFGILAARAINNGRSNFTRAIKRNFFQPGLDARTRHIPPGPHCIIYGTYQLAKGCMKNEPNQEVQCAYGYVHEPYLAF
jgi:hypothetical protein